MKTASISYLILTSFVLLLANPAHCQRKNASRLKVAYIQAADNSRYLDGSIIVRVKRYEPLANALVEIKRFESEQEVVVGKLSTDKYGLFRFKLDSEIEKWMNEKGEIEFAVTYSGNDTIREARRSISITPAYLALDFKKVEDENVVEVRALRMNPEGQREAIEDTKIEVYVKSLFNPLLIGSETTDMDGIASITFPNDLPGNREGELSVLVKINEHDNYGTISKEGMVKWGIPYIQPEIEQRGLGDTDAPLWMVYTLIVLLSAVWFHYLYVIFMIFKIKTSK